MDTAKPSLYLLSPTTKKKHQYKANFNTTNLANSPAIQASLQYPVTPQASVDKEPDTYQAQHPPL